MTLVKHSRAAARSAFTLMEMMVVVAIIVVVAGMGSFYVLKQLDKAKESRARAEVKATLTTAVEMYYKDHDSTWPASLQVLLEQDANGGPYLKTAEALLDPWGKPYQYNPQGANNGGRQPDIWCESPSGPIGNWQAAH